MKRKMPLIFAVCCMFLISACSASPNSSTKENGSAESSIATVVKDEKKIYQNITAEEAKKMMDSENVIIVDVRTEEEYSDSHIPGAVLVPVESIGEEAPAALADPDATLLIYCRSGNRSKKASEKLSDLGYTSIYEFGGIVDWPYETVKGEE